MTSDSAAAAQALTAMHDSQARLARAATCPPARHLAFAAVMAVLVAAPVLPVLASMGVLAADMVAVFLIYRWDRKRLGMFINGWRSGRTRPVAFGLWLVCMALYVAGFLLKTERGVWWAPLACAAVAAVAAWFGSRMWQAAFRREMGLA